MRAEWFGVGKCTRQEGMTVNITPNRCRIYNKIGSPEKDLSWDNRRGRDSLQPPSLSGESRA
jgi:hypothetical protein